MWAGALYYPYMRIRDEDWLKASALYWDSLRRFKPTSYRLRDSLVGKQLIMTSCFFNLAFIQNNNLVCMLNR